MRATDPNSEPSVQASHAAAQPGRAWMILVIGFIVLGWVGVAMLWWHMEEAGVDRPVARSQSGLAEASPSSVDLPAPPAAESGAAEPARAADFEKLKGRWLRQDGDYVLEIRDVAESGKTEAAYFNPRPIHVARAETASKAGSIEVFVELRDAGYPGCTYRLRYRPGPDQLEGTYYQAADGASYDVTFDRMK